MRLFFGGANVAGGAESITCYDKIGREVRRGKSSFQGDWIYVDTKYNRAGLVEQVSEPYKFTAHTYTWFSYDRLGRTILVSHPVLGYTYTHYNGLATAVVNDAGQRKTEFRDAAGDLFQARDDDGNTPEAIFVEGSFGVRERHNRWRRQNNGSAGLRSMGQAPGGIQLDAASAVRDTIHLVRWRQAQNQ
jgi:hypothetical protein